MSATDKRKIRKCAFLTSIQIKSLYMEKFWNFKEPQEFILMLASVAIGFVIGREKFDGLFCRKNRTLHCYGAGNGFFISSAYTCNGAMTESLSETVTFSRPVLRTMYNAAAQRYYPSDNRSSSSSSKSIARAQYIVSKRENCTDETNKSSKDSIQFRCTSALSSNEKGICIRRRRRRRRVYIPDMLYARGAIIRSMAPFTGLEFYERSRSGCTVDMSCTLLLFRKRVFARSRRGAPHSHLQLYYDDQKLARFCCYVRARYIVVRTCIYIDASRVADGGWRTTEAVHAHGRFSSLSLSRQSAKRGKSRGGCAPREYASAQWLDSLTHACISTPIPIEKRLHTQLITLFLIYSSINQIIEISHLSPKDILLRCEMMQKMTSEAFLRKNQFFYTTSLFLHNILKERPKDAIASFEKYSRELRAQKFSNQNRHLRDLYEPPPAYDEAKRLVELFKISPPGHGDYHSISTCHEDEESLVEMRQNAPDLQTILLLPASRRSSATRRYRLPRSEHQKIDCQGEDKKCAVYFVCNRPGLDGWTELPPVTPAQIVVARQTVYMFSGMLANQVRGPNLFIYSVDKFLVAMNRRKCERAPWYTRVFTYFSSGDDSPLSRFIRIRLFPDARRIICAPRLLASRRPRTVPRWAILRSAEEEPEARRTTTNSRRTRRRTTKRTTERRARARDEVRERAPSSCIGI
ncbi:unnamed protein product [Trichogramma brassicae]|uniref:Uncharacterized protein n=1 Tax=Trichogramma brassicae TaxID=86971 RepID=A0A6H5IEH5_9HYME|nr:unnamed protein product [Trichogramma brassicae]